MTHRTASTLVFVTSALVLVLETIAGRLMAPYIGISIETFTGIIGTVLAGIALGSALGGRLADRRDPAPMIGHALVAGGALTWLALPVVLSMGPAVPSTPGGIVLLTAAAFFAPAAVLSAVTPMAVKLRLEDLDSTGEVVGGLSAAGTVGALAGTFATGFILIGLLPVRLIILLIGLALVVAGVGWNVRVGRRPAASDIAMVIIAAGLAAAMPDQCDHETDYFCARIEVDEERASGRSLYLDDRRHAHVDLDDPSYIDLRYIRLFADVAATLPGGPLDVLHVGGGGFSFPRHLEAERPGSDQVVLEIDGALLDIAEAELDFDRNAFDVRVGDARLAMDELDSDTFDLVIGDAFGSHSVPWHLTTREFVAEVRRVLTGDGVYVLNVIDGDQSSFAKAELATLADTFEHVTLVLPSDGVPRRRSVNQVLIASDEPITPPEIAEGDGRLVTGSELHAFFGDARVLTDDFAPVDQLMR